MRLGIDVLVNRTCRSAERRLFDRPLQFLPGGLHQRRVERTADGKPECAACSRGFEPFAGGIDRLRSARDDQLAGAVVVGCDYNAVNGVAGLFDRAVLESEDGGHRPGLRLACLLHRCRTFGDQTQTVLEREGSRDHEGREFAQRVSGRRIGPDAERLGQNDRMKEYGGLRHAGLLELLVRSGEHDVGNAEAQNLVGTFKKLPRTGYRVVKVFAHAYGLSALAGENVCVFHRFLFLFDGAKVRNYFHIFAPPCSTAPAGPPCVTVPICGSAWPPPEQAAGRGRACGR